MSGMPPKAVIAGWINPPQFLLPARSLHDANVESVCRGFSNGTSDRRMLLRPSYQFCKLFRIGIVCADPNTRAKRRHPRRNSIVESQNPAVIAVALDDDLEHCEIHAE